MKFSKWTLVLIMTLCACLTGCAGFGSWVETAGEDIGAIQTVEIERTPVIDPVTNQQAVDADGVPLWNVVEHKDFTPGLKGTVTSTFGGWGTLAMGVLSVLLGAVTTERTVTAARRKKEAAENKEAAVELIRAGADSGSTEKLKAQIGKRPANDPIRSKIRELAPLA